MGVALLSDLRTIEQELRDYPAFDPKNTVIAVDHDPEGYNIIPRTSVLQAADEIASLRAQVETLEAIDLAKAKQIVVLQAQLASARKALEPFAEIAKEFTPQLSNSHKNTMHWAVPTVGDFRRALVAYTDDQQNRVFAGGG